MAVNVPESRNVAVSSQQLHRTVLHLPSESVDPTAPLPFAFSRLRLVVNPPTGRDSRIGRRPRAMCGRPGRPRSVLAQPGRAPDAFALSPRAGILRDAR